MVKKDLFLVLNDIRSAFNVGSIFRTADAFGVSKIYLCGYTPTPEFPKMLKTSLGAENFVKWEKRKSMTALLKKLKKEGVNLVAVEQMSSSKNINDFKPKYPMALIFGNEVRGLPKDIEGKADQLIEIPMKGKKESLNVAVAAGIALYALTS